jgi:Uma2 family endonuclease
MWDCEYLLLFGLPENKWELFDGRMHCRFPFPSHEIAEAHLESWSAVLGRWKRRQAKVVASAEAVRSIEVGNFRLNLYKRPVELELPINADVLHQVYRDCWNPGAWSDDDSPQLAGVSAQLAHQDVKFNLWQIFESIEHGGVSFGGVDVMLNETTSVAPDFCFYASPREECMIGGEYFAGAPELVCEVLSASSRDADLHQRRELYQRSGVSWLWLLDPERELLERHRLVEGRFELDGIFQVGQEISLLPASTSSVSVDEIFDTQEKRRACAERLSPSRRPTWIFPEDARLGLEYLMVLGHPDRRYEIWNNRSHCRLAFGSPIEAKCRFDFFLEEIGLWEGESRLKASCLGNELEVAESGRFRLSRQNRFVHLEVAVDGRKYRRLLENWTKHEHWLWGDQKTGQVTES